MGGVGSAGVAFSLAANTDELFPLGYFMMFSRTVSMLLYAASADSRISLDEYLPSGNANIPT